MIKDDTYINLKNSETHDVEIKNVTTNHNQLRSPTYIGGVKLADSSGELYVNDEPIGSGDYYTKTESDNKFVQKTQTIAGIALSGDISSQDLTDNLVFATDSDIENLFN